LSTIAGWPDQSIQAPREAGQRLFQRDRSKQCGRASGTPLAFDQSAMRARSFDQPEGQQKKKLMQGMNDKICGSVLTSRALYQTPFGLPVVKHPQQASTGSGMENRRGRLDPDSRPGGEEFRASST
jgi:hypothetical protein